MSDGNSNSFLKLARQARWAALVCFVIFTANVILGKSSLVFGWKLTFLLDGTPEFVLLLISVLFFMINAIFQEQVRKNNNNSHH